MTYLSRDPRCRKDLEARAFAVEMLLPLKLFKRLKKLNYSNPKIANTLSLDLELVNLREYLAPKL